MKALILAAGYATRLYPLTKDKAKALLPIGDKLMIDYLMDNLATIKEIDKAYIVTNHRFAGQFAEWAENRADKHIAIDVVDDGTSTNETRLGAIGDMQFAIEQFGIDDDLLVAACDNFFTFGLEEYGEMFKKYGDDLVMAKTMPDYEERKRFAIAEVDDEYKIVSLEEKPQQPKSDLAVYAVYLYRRDTVKMIKQYLDEGNNPDAPGNFPAWLFHKKPVRVYVFNGECIDIGTVASYDEVCARMTNG